VILTPHRETTYGEKNLEKPPRDGILPNRWGSWVSGVKERIDLLAKEKKKAA
jgi:hypothetical protein